MGRNVGCPGINAVRQTSLANDDWIITERNPAPGSECCDQCWRWNGIAAGGMGHGAIWSDNMLVITAIHMNAFYSVRKKKI